MSYSQYPSPKPQYPSQPFWQAGEPPLSAPHYRAPFLVAVRRFFKKYATFSGRASRSEYWWWVLVSAAVGVILNIFIGVGTSASAYGSSVGPGTVIGIALSVIWFLATIVPSLALSVRRLHDANFSGLFLLLLLIPALGALALIVLMVMPPNPAGRRFDNRSR